MLTNTLSAEHLASLKASDISEEVSAERGYRTVVERDDLLRLGFGARQVQVPALLIPLHDVHGQLSGYSIRPNQPRVGMTTPFGPSALT